MITYTMRKCRNSSRRAKSFTTEHAENTEKSRVAFVNKNFSVPRCLCGYFGFGFFCSLFPVTCSLSAFEVWDLVIGIFCPRPANLGSAAILAAFAA